MKKFFYTSPTTIWDKQLLAFFLYTQYIYIHHQQLFGLWVLS